MPRNIDELKRICFDMISDRKNEPIEIDTSLFERICCDKSGYFNQAWEEFSLSQKLIAKYKSSNKQFVGIFVNDKLHFY